MGKVSRKKTKKGEFTIRYTTKYYWFEDTSGYEVTRIFPKEYTFRKLFKTKREAFKFITERSGGEA